MEKATEWLDLVKRRNRPMFVSKVRRLKNELARINPEYLKSYEAMHKMLETLGKDD